MILWMQRDRHFQQTLIITAQGSNMATRNHSGRRSTSFCIPTGNGKWL